MKIISLINPFFYNYIIPFFKKNWQIIMIFILIIFIITKDNGGKKLIKEYEKQIKKSENLVRDYKKDIQKIDIKIDSLSKIIKKIDEEEVEIVEKIKDVENKGKSKINKINKEENSDVLIDSYKKTIKKHEKD